MSLRWFLIIFAIGFVASLSGFSRANFLPRTAVGRIIASFLALLILFLLGITLWDSVLPLVLNR